MAEARVWNSLKYFNLNIELRVNVPDEIKWLMAAKKPTLFLWSKCRVQRVLAVAEGPRDADALRQGERAVEVLLFDCHRRSNKVDTQHATVDVSWQNKTEKIGHIQRLRGGSSENVILKLSEFPYNAM